MRVPPVPIGRRPLILIAAALALALGACSASGAATPAASAQAPTPVESAAASPAAAGTDAVTIADFAFAPGSITVKAGTTVTWTNNDTASHTVTAEDGSFDSKSIANGATFSQAFAKAGTYAYHCTIHSSMTGTVVVQ